jgi:signal transduction histidine kinase
VLLDKNQELELLNATKDKFFSIISHDLQNPLSAFRNVTKALNNAIDNIGKDEIKYYISELNDSSVSLYRLLRSLLQWAQTQTGRISFKRERINLLEAINKTIELFELNVNEKQLELFVTIDKNSFVYADEKVLQTILRNLISNAIKFTPEKGKIEISCSTNYNYEEISIKDTGIGISGHDVEKLFKISEDTKTIGNSKEKGSGLGLIICKEMIEKCGGQIFVESELNKGTNFKFTLSKSKNG